MNELDRLKLMIGELFVQLAQLTAERDKLRQQVEQLGTKNG